MSALSPIIILTGASRGLGLAVLSLLLSHHNARVTTLSRSSTTELQNTVKQYGEDRVLAIQGDVGDAEVNAGAVKQTVDKWGGIDGLVLNAGTMSIFRLDAVPLEYIPGYIETNLSSSIYLIQPALPYLRKSTLPSPLSSSTTSKSTGRIVLVSSGASSKGYVAWGLYSAVKAALNSVARTLAAEENLNGSGVGVWAIRPGLVDMQDLLRSSGAESMHPNEFARLKTAYDEGNLLRPEQPGSVLAGLVARGGPMDLSGEYLNWADERLLAYRT
ncbi:hypothetical protein BCR39DRAFT_567695 [Naematelia encephala]|uniref:NAD(P)-binding protein n=1 Tax=Naematelia encephala TaxID=71784 RepID=A0A1Y2BLL0_9TREE|nr:hypothetical protein BCR39DRAFT_567695 [Naematelia encephala]